MNFESAEIEQKQLQSSLSSFGLSPNDWKIEPQNNNLILIKNKFEESFYFIGETVRSKKLNQIDWKFITLASL
jgi:hypothetical protein